MIQYNKAALSDYLRGCVNITALAEEKGDTWIGGDRVVGAYLDLRHNGYDIVILALSVEHPSGDETKGEIKYVYRTISTSEGADGYSPDYVVKEGVSNSLPYSTIVGDRIRYIQITELDDDVTKVEYRVRAVRDIFFTGRLCVTIQYWYFSGLPLNDIPDGQFAFHGHYTQTPRNGYFSEASRPDLQHHQLTSRDIYDAIVRHERQWTGRA